MKFAQKLYYLFFAFFTVLFLAMVAYIYWMQTTGIKNQLAPKLDTVTERLAEDSKALIENRNQGGIDQVLDEGIRQSGVEGRIAYLRILDENLSIYSSKKDAEENFISPHPSDQNIFELLNTTDNRMLVRSITTNVGEVYDVSVLIWINSQNYVFRAGYYLGTGLNLPAGVVLMLFTFLGVLTVLFVLIISRIIIRPVEDLTREANQIARGADRDFLSARMRDDEIGDLARALQVLLKELENQRKQLAEQEKLAVLGKGSGRMTHNMSNLLNPLDHYFQIVHDELEKCETSEQFVYAILNIEKHINLVRNDLMQLRNAIPDKPQREKYPITVLIETALSRLLVPENIQICKKVDAAIQVWIDPEQLTAVFHNLFLNAFQAMPDGGELYISTELQKRDVQITVRDSGIGIAEENMANIFQFFYSTKKDGMGIGLSSSAEIVRNHGGTMTVNSIEHEGTTFFIKLPLYKPLE
jgi:signal transduction histidine kinase